MAVPARLGKTDALSRWESIEENQPIKMTPIDAGKKGSTYAEDTIRLTGSQEFIDSVLSNLKGVLDFENESSSRLEIIYTQTCERIKDDDGKLVQGELTGSYAFYCKSKSRGGGRNGRKKGSKNRDKVARHPLREVNAGLKLRNGLREVAAAKTKPSRAQPTAPAYIDALYAIATRFTDPHDGHVEYEWLEPIDHPIFPMQTYTDVCEFDEAIDRMVKKLKVKRAALQKIEVKVESDGTLTYEEF